MSENTHHAHSERRTHLSLRPNLPLHATHHRLPWRSLLLLHVGWGYLPVHWHRPLGTHALSHHHVLWRLLLLHVAGRALGVALLWIGRGDSGYRLGGMWIWHWRRSASRGVHGRAALSFPIGRGRIRGFRLEKNRVQLELVTGG